MTSTKIDRIRIRGFRSLRDVDLRITPVTVLIGANGAGKSNLLWAMEMIRMLAFEALQVFVAERGGATFLMHYGPQKTAAIDIDIEFTTERGQNAYSARLGYGANEALVFLWERAGYRPSEEHNWRWSELGAGHIESRLKDGSLNDKTVASVRSLLRQVNFYHFHDTSRTSALRTRDFANTSGNYLRSDGSNLATFLDGLSIAEDEAGKAAWRRIEGSLRRVAPFITAVTPTRDRHGTQLQWTDDVGETFGPAHLSDGTLRALALIAALAQPEAGLPLVSCIDEPELGLHPAAVEVLCGIISSVAERKTVIVSTQAPAVLDHFQPNSVVVAERKNGATEFRRLDEADLRVWLEDYSLSELFDKNLLGGRP